MEKRRELGLIAILLIAAVLMSLIAPYNDMVKLRNNVRENYSQIEIALQGRLEKIPDIVATVESYTQHEETVLIEVTNARSGLEKAIESGDMDQISAADENLTTAIKSLQVVVEAYPELKASELYVMLIDEVAGSSNRVNQARRSYNLAVTDYNNRLESFPAVLYARMLGFEPAKYFEAQEAAHTTNVVNFGN